jgi:hypothetical protein
LPICHQQRMRATDGHGSWRQRARAPGHAGRPAEARSGGCAVVTFVRAQPETGVVFVQGKAGPCCVLP